MKKRSLVPGDDGHTIIPMNVPGMTWYQEEKPDALVSGEREILSKQETRWYIFGALRSALLVGGVMIAGITLFSLLLLWIW